MVKPVRKRKGKNGVPVRALIDSFLQQGASFKAPPHGVQLSDKQRAIIEELSQRFNGASLDVTSSGKEVIMQRRNPQTHDDVTFRLPVDGRVPLKKVESITSKTGLAYNN